MMDPGRAVPEPGPGQLRIRNHYLSLDPYMRGRMEESKSYAEPQKIGETMIGGTVGVVEISNHAGLAAGDTVVGLLGSISTTKENEYLLMLVS